MIRQFIGALAGLFGSSSKSSPSKKAERKEARRAVARNTSKVRTSPLVLRRSAKLNRSQERDRRRRQIERGVLRAENGLRPREEA